MRLEPAKDGLRYFVMDSKNNIAKVFYSKEKAVGYIKSKQGR